MEFNKQLQRNYPCAATTYINHPQNPRYTHPHYNFTAVFVCS